MKNMQRRIERLEKLEKPDLKPLTFKIDFIGPDKKIASTLILRTDQKSLKCDSQ